MEKLRIRFVVTIAIALSLAACGRSKDNSSVSDTVISPVKAEGAEGKDSAKDGKEIPSSKKETFVKGQDKNGKQPDGLQIKPEEKDKNKDQDKKTVPEKGNNGTPKSNETAKGKGSGQEGSGKQVQRSNDITDEEVAQMLAEANRYSGASADGLRDYLLYRHGQGKDNQQKIRNLKLANDIKKADLRFDYLTGKYKIQITMLSDSKVIGLIGDIRAEANSLASNQRGVVATGTCMDQSGGLESACETVVVDLSYQNSNALIVLRQTGVLIRGIFPARSCLTKACEDVYGLLRNTELKTKEPNRIRKAVLDTFEVIQGRSGFRLFVTTEENEVIKIAGPLANQLQYPVLDTPTDRVLTAEELRDAQTGEIYKTVIHNSLYDVNIVTNDGYGNINLMVRMPVQRNGDRDHFQLYLNRKIQPIRVIAD